jgi:uncharacterized membrane protein YjfL (UPF0719 family)
VNQTHLFFLGLGFSIGGLISLAALQAKLFDEVSRNRNRVISISGILLGTVLILISLDYRHIQEVSMVSFFFDSKTGYFLLLVLTIIVVFSLQKIIKNWSEKQRK